MELTEVTFWENYWADCKLPSTVDLGFSFERCLARELKKNLPDLKGDIFEVGCAPGKWLAFMAKEFAMRPSGIEYSEAGMQATLENFKILRLVPGLILTGDFLQAKPVRQFDVVMSLGFIEHFANVDEVVALHLQWLKPGGILILGVPNFCGIYAIIQGILAQEILAKHNLTIMNLGYFRSLAARFRLKPVFLDYLGSFEPSLPIVKYRFGNPLQFMIRSLLWVARRIRRAQIFDGLNNRFISSYILAIYRKE
ncbi:MAG: methyltransferase [Deltaproteobacteria bacterium RIFOXYD12_FULL_55_16]|nr:MAG: methyltransferase [Deltaproteobacteria bacterium RIFOXYD12_FULL_55_16]